MEARLLQARNYKTSQPEMDFSWHIHKAELGGIPVSPGQFEGMPGKLLELDQATSEFLLELLGNKGAWKGWKLHAIGKWNTRCDEGSYFDMVLVRNSEAKPMSTVDTDNFEMVSGIGKGV